MKIISYYTLVTLMTFFTVMVSSVFAQGGNTHSIIPCGFSNQSACKFSDLIVLVNNLIDNLFLKLAVPLATLSIAIAGVMYVFFSTNEASRRQANDILWSTIKGFVIALSAYLIVKAIILGLVNTEVAPGSDIKKILQ